MSWKPGKGGGVLIDKYTRRSESFRKEYASLIESGQYLKFENLNSLSMCLYLYWLNENKVFCTLTGRSFDKANPHYSLQGCAQFPLIIPMLKRNLHLVYKPMQEILKNLN